MLKRLHLFFVLMLMAGVAGAQKIAINDSHRLPEIPTAQRMPLMRFQQSPRFVPRRPAITVDPDNQLWWGYYPDTQISSIALGSKGLDEYWVAMGIPTSEQLPQGKSIKAVRFALAGTAGLSDFHLWIAESLPHSLSDVAVDVPVKTADLIDQNFTEVELPQAYEVPAGRTLYVGYTFKVTELVEGADYPVIIRYNGANIDESCWVNIPALTYGEWTDQFKQYGPVAMHVLLDGEFQHNAVSVSESFVDIFAVPGGTAEATVTLTSQGLGEVKSIDYIVGDANTESEERHLHLVPFEGIGSQQTIKIPMTADAEIGRSPRYITITKVNGVENAVEDAIASGYCVTVSKAAPRKTVVEEFTGTWCGWCPMGITGMQKVNEQFPNEAITLIIHSDDPMQVSYGASAPSYPYAMVNRSTPASPYYGITDKPLGICDLVAEKNSETPEASVVLQQPVLTKSGSITFKTDVTFYYNNTKSNYTMGYVLLSDDLKGEGRNWAQANYFCQEENKAYYADDEYLRPWVEGSPYMKMTYDHVVIDSKDMDAEGTIIKAPIVDGDVRTLSSSFSLTGNTVMQHFEGLSVVAVLFNKATGSIVNADIQPVTIAEDFAANKAQLKNFNPTTVLKSSESKVVVPVANFGTEGIKSLDYTVSTGTTEIEKRHLDLNEPITTFGIYTPVEFALTTPDETGVSKYTITLTAVNGKDNEATTGKVSANNLTTILKNSPRKTVIEEYTGTWCPWCPRGLAALKRASVEYPNDAVLLSIHSGSGDSSDPMQVATFSNLIKGHQFPSADVNRYRAVDPYHGEGDSGWGLGAVIEDEQSHLTEAAIDLQQPVLDELTNVISFTTDVTFQINRATSPYLLSFVLVADGLTGTGSSWTQANYYPYFGADESDPYMAEIVSWPVMVEGLVYDHVAIAAIGIDGGLANSLKSPVEEGQVQSYSGRFNIKNNALAKQAKTLRVAALLYDKTRKCFINADQKDVMTMADGIHDTALGTEAREAERYATDGRRLTAPARGINIVRMSDGQVRKVMVK